MTFLLRIHFKDGHIEEHRIIMFSDLCTDLDRSKYYYYEQLHHLSGKGVKIKRSDVSFVEVIP